MLLRCYRSLAAISYALSRPWLEFRARMEGPDGMWAGRLGLLSGEARSIDRPDIWLQAVSIGEVGVAEALVRALDRQAPGLKILLSTSTAAGFVRAQAALGDRCPVIIYPLDFPQVVRRLAREIRPKVYAALETELWPNLIQAVRDIEGHVVLLNGRISALSFPWYRRLKALTSPVLSSFTKICAISEVHAQRLAVLGAPPERILVTGNAKFEGLLERPVPAKAACLRERFRIGPEAYIWVAGSLRGGEEVPVVEACGILRRKWPRLVVFLVPRHLKGVQCLERALDRERVVYQLWSDIEVSEERISSVVVVDVMGPLFDLYGIADVAFVGGSLVPKGGQNVMEPASWACPVLYGPHTDNFEDARSCLDRHGGGREVQGGETLAVAVSELLSEPERRQEQGRLARSALEDLAGGAATRQAEVLLDVLRQGVFP